MKNTEKPFCGSIYLGHFSNSQILYSFRTRIGITAQKLQENGKKITRKLYNILLTKFILIISRKLSIIIIIRDVESRTILKMFLKHSNLLIYKKAVILLGI